METRAIIYLTFNGNCRQAMTFYKACLGGELTFERVGAFTKAPKLPKKMANVILHASLIKDHVVIMGTDMAPSSGLIKGNNAAVLLQCSSERQTRRAFKKLAAGGQATRPLSVTHWGALFGQLTDRFGNHWLLNFSPVTKERAS